MSAQAWVRETKHAPNRGSTISFQHRSFDFISIDKPEDTNTAANRKAIRSRAAKLQHAHSASQKQRRQTRSKSAKLRTKVRVTGISKIVEGKPNPSLVETSVHFNSLSWIWTFQSQSNQPNESDDTSCNETIKESNISTEITSDVIKQESQAPDYAFSTDALYLDAGSIDPFHSLPVPWRPFMPALIHHCELNFFQEFSSLE